MYTYINRKLLRMSSADHDNLARNAASIGSGEKIWYTDVKTLFSSSNLTKIWFSGDDGLDVRLNVLVRFAIYYGMLISIIKGRSWPLALPVMIGVLTYLVYENKKHIPHVLGKQLGAKHSDAGEAYTMKSVVVPGSVQRTGDTYPTVRNPVMNFMLNDMTDNPERPAAANVMDAGVKRSMAAAYAAGIPHDARDIFGRNTGERHFYTMPCTTSVNDVDVFARWLFRPDDSVTWKEKAVLGHRQ